MKSNNYNTNSILSNIKSIFSLQNIFSYTPPNLFFEITRGSKKLLQKFQITNEAYKEMYELKKFSKPSYHIKKYFDYFGIVRNSNNEENYLKEKILCAGLNKSQFSIAFFIGDLEWEYIIKNFQKINLVICPYSLFYLDNLNKENINEFYQKLYLYKNNITQVTIYDFNDNNCTLNIENSNKIINFLKNIFAQNVENDKIKTDNYDNKNNVKKLCFKSNKIPKYYDFIKNLFINLFNILSLKSIEELIIDKNFLDDYQFTDIMNFIKKQMTVIKTLKINNGIFRLSNYADLNILFSNYMETIEKLDLSDTLCSCDIISILNNKRYPLKEVKLSLYSYYSEIGLFLGKNINSLEVFQIEIKNKNIYNLSEMIENLNKMEKLKYMKLLGCLDIYQLYKFSENENLEYLNIDIFIPDSYIFEKLPNLDEIMDNFLKNFRNLKSLILETTETLKNQNFKKFTFPRKLSCLELINFKGESLQSLLNTNKEWLNNVEEFKIEKTTFKESKEFIQLFECLNLKNLKKLSINNIILKDFNDILFSKENVYSFCKKSVFYKDISLILKNCNLFELDISKNDYYSLFQKRKFLYTIKSSITKKLLNIKLFNNHTSLFQNDFNFLQYLFGYSLDEINIFLIINQNSLQKNS